MPKNFTYTILHPSYTLTYTMHCADTQYDTVRV